MNIISSNNVSSINNSIMSTFSEYKDKYNNLSELTKKTKGLEESITSRIIEIIPVTSEFILNLEKQYSNFIIIKVLKALNAGALPFDQVLYNQLKALGAEVNNLQECLSLSNSSFEEKDINTLCEQEGQDTCATSTQQYCNTSGLGLEPSNFDKVLDGNVYGTCTNWYEACNNQFSYCNDSTVCDLSFAESLDCTYKQGCGACEASCQDKCQKACQSTCEISCEANCQSHCQSTCEITYQSACENLCQDVCNIACLGSCQSCHADCLDACESNCQDSCLSTCQTSCQYNCEAECESNCQTLCEAACQSNCQISCLSACQTSCQNNCETSCQSLDQNNCTMASESGCTSISDSMNICQNNCQSACIAVCNIDCQECQSACESSCQTICEGACQSGDGPVCTVTV